MRRTRAFDCSRAKASRPRVSETRRIRFEFNDGESIACDRLLLATGGCSKHPARRARRSLGHTIEPPVLHCSRSMCPRPGCGRCRCFGQRCPGFSGKLRDARAAPHHAQWTSAVPRVPLSAGARAFARNELSVLTPGELDSAMNETETPDRVSIAQDRRTDRA